VANWRLEAARALNEVLGSFHRLDGQTLRAVWRIDDHGNYARVILDFDKTSFVVEACPDDDTVEFWTEETIVAAEDRTDASKATTWTGVIGKPFGWGWITINQQGYCDGILLSFGGISPQVMLQVVASSLKETKLG